MPMTPRMSKRLIPIAGSSRLFPSTRRICRRTRSRSLRSCSRSLRASRDLSSLGCTSYFEPRSRTLYPISQSQELQESEVPNTEPPRGPRSWRDIRFHFPNQLPGGFQEDHRERIPRRQWHRRIGSGWPHSQVSSSPYQTISKLERLVDLEVKGLC